MQRRSPGRQAERSGPPDWQERGERAYRDTGERDFRGDESRRHDADYESAYRRFASEDVGPEDWGSEWSERSARSSAEQRGADAGADWRGAPGGPGGPGGSRDPAWESGRGYGNRGRTAEGGQGREGAHADQPRFRGQHRTGWHGGEGDYDAYNGRDQRRADASGLSRFGDAAQREAMRHRRGPKGYTRSDERIREDVCERLAHALDIDVSDVSVQVRDGRVELDGTVPQRWMKHDIEDIADGCMGVRDVENRVRVRRDGEQPDTGMVLHPSQRTVTPTQPAARDPEPGSGAGRERDPRR
ncbi:MULTISPECIES: BON domain-containing protein [unclassified Burkholderia]|uniref:BON domain-containing protein n=1 Tax=unclassified Burkholderia TaxID=2613784 RepID=UPI000F56F6C4|nr:MULTISPECIES: BON domain-containing protein [unclassified Burkholderia]RQR86536.1 BON domain-containing protein [Burkholderia sp. Bp9011]RQR96032.1 BON domain-containing protein [Burkholderia sp. Bp9010]RQS58665.1 BON domain-containing protein [Burkholderia sp. Bp8986]RQS63096.1 BON domain-containing protein [Burkholderia sp. Bp8984]RQS78798.1 BON domain-containing protein [Burkholderia sp. Bp8977]